MTRRDVNNALSRASFISTSGSSHTTEEGLRWVEQASQGPVFGNKSPLVLSCGRVGSEKTPNCSRILGTLCLGWFSQGISGPQGNAEAVGWEQAQVCSLSSAQTEPGSAEDPRPTPTTNLESCFIMKDTYFQRSNISILYPERCTLSLY